MKYGTLSSVQRAARGKQSSLGHRPSNIVNTLPRKSMTATSKCNRKLRNVPSKCKRPKLCAQKKNKGSVVRKKTMQFSYKRLEKRSAKPQLLSSDSKPSGATKWNREDAEKPSASENANSMLLSSLEEFVVSEIATQVQAMPVHATDYIYAHTSHITHYTLHSASFCPAQEHYNTLSDNVTTTTHFISFKTCPTKKTTPN